VSNGDQGSQGCSRLKEVVQKLMGTIGALLQNASEPAVVAEVIYQAATDGTNQLRYTAAAGLR
jgi:hypothetical protein